MATKIKVIYTVAAEFVVDTDDHDKAVAAGDNFSLQQLMNDGGNLYTNLDQVELADDPVPDGDEQVYDLQGVELPAETTQLTSDLKVGIYKGSRGCYELASDYADMGNENDAYCSIDHVVDAILNSGEQSEREVEFIKALLSAKARGNDYLLVTLL